MDNTKTNENGEVNNVDENIESWIKENWEEKVSSFEDLNLKMDILRGVYSYGFEKPSLIQAKAILPMIKGRDILAQAYSGTGKTASFTIGSLELIDPSIKYVQTLVLTSTRDLAIAIAKVYQAIGEYHNAKILAFAGATNLKQDIKIINDGVHTIVGTPGRIIDLINKNILKLNFLKVFILDETDEMLSRGFKDNLTKIIAYLPETCSRCLFTGTVDSEILEFSKILLKNPVQILYKNEEVTLEGVRQFYIHLKNEWKTEILLNLYKMMEISQTIIFCNNKKILDNLADILKKQGYSFSKISEDTQEQDKDKLMRDFRVGNTRILLSTDLVTKGKDIHQADLIINFDLPQKIDLYKQRIGRLGKFGKKVTSISFVTNEENLLLNEIIQFFKVKIDELPTDLTNIK